MKYFVSNSCFSTVKDTQQDRSMLKRLLLNNSPILGECVKKKSSSKKRKEKRREKERGKEIKTHSKDFEKVKNDLKKFYVRGNYFSFKNTYVHTRF